MEGETENIFQIERDNIIVCTRVRRIEEDEKISVIVQSPNVVTVGSLDLQNKINSFAFDYVASGDISQVSHISLHECIITSE